MHVYFEELSRAKRAGGIETACSQLIEQFRQRNVLITRSSENPWDSTDALPDCVHIQGIWSPALAQKFWQWKKRKVACVVSPHGMLERWALSHKFFRKKLAWWLYQKTILNRADSLHATSEPEAAQMKRLKLTAPIAVIPWGIKATSVEPGTKPDTKRKHEPHTAVFVGRLCPIKGLPMLFEAWQKIQPTGWKLRIIGPDEAGYRSVLESKVNALGLQQVIAFEGAFSQPDVEKALLQADLFVLPSHSENFGMVVGEALALGLPVLTTCGTPWKRISDTKCGWWVPPTVDKLAAALQEATSTSTDQLQRMGAIGAELIRSEYTWEASVQKFYDLYATMANYGSTDIGKVRSPS